MQPVQLIKLEPKSKESRSTFSKELENYTYYIPPNYTVPNIEEVSFTLFHITLLIASHSKKNLGNSILLTCNT